MLYGAAEYCCWLLDPEKYVCKHLYAKPRVASMKTITIPRLALDAARLAARVAREEQKEIDWTFSRTVF